MVKLCNYCTVFVVCFNSISQTLKEVASIKQVFSTNCLINHCNCDQMIMSFPLFLFGFLPSKMSKVFVELAIHPVSHFKMDDPLPCKVFTSYNILPITCAIQLM